MGGYATAGIVGHVECAVERTGQFAVMVIVWIGTNAGEGVGGGGFVAGRSGGIEGEPERRRLVVKDVVMKVDDT